jgi:hypothetical protein
VGFQRIAIARRATDHPVGDLRQCPARKIAISTRETSMRHGLSGKGRIAAALATCMSASTAWVVAAEPTIVELTQVPCQFLESEHGKNHGYKSTEKADCEAINAKSRAERLDAAKTIELKPGKHVFRVTNRAVPYEVGFWLRGDGVLNRLSLPSVSSGGLTAGKTRDYEVFLELGEYLYSCPLNPTLDYKIVVK